MVYDCRGLRVSGRMMNVSADVGAEALNLHDPAMERPFIVDGCPSDWLALNLRLGGLSIDPGGPAESV